MVSLFVDMVFAENLTYNEACKLLSKALKTPAAKYVTFFIGNSNCNRRCKCLANGKWQLMGYSKEISREYIKNPEDFEMC